jgi:hypothetical protein
LTITRDALLAGRRQSIRQQLQAQRQVIAERISPASRAAGTFPRSMTLRLLLARPDLVAGVLAPRAGPGFARTIAALFVLLPLAVAAAQPPPERIAR